MFSYPIQESPRGSSEFREPPGPGYRPMMASNIEKAASHVRDRVANVVPLDGRKVQLFWRSGFDEVIDLKPLLTRFARRPVASRELVFRTVRPGVEGRSVIWDDGSEIGLSWLQDLALARMTGQEFREALGKLNLTVEEAAAHLGVSRRSIAGYRRDRQIPRAIVLAVRFILHRRARAD